jgi:dCTP deaminase
MILTAQRIDTEVTSGRIVITPYDERLLNPNSYNFRLAERLVVYREGILDPRVANATEEIVIPAEGLVIAPGQLYLGGTVEVMGSNHFVPLIYGRSSIGRMGLFVQITAPLGDIGYVGRWTLQLTPVRPLRIYSGMKIGQVFFVVPHGEITPYKGKYQGSMQPCASRSYQDFTEHDDPHAA